MRTDVVFESADRCIVLDKKFYAEALKGRYGGRKLNSSHLYQLFTYVQNRSAEHDGAPVHEGMLLYPVVEEPSRSTIGSPGSDSACGPWT